MRPIKFDLPLNGTRIATLAQMEDNLTPEILEPFRSGKLAKWLRARSLDEQAGAVEALLATDVQDEVQLFIKLCEVFEREVDEEIASEMIEDYKASLASKNTATEEIVKTQQIELVEKDDENQADESSLSMALVKVNDMSEEQIEGNDAKRAELAAQPNLSEKVQNKLLQDKAESVLVALASNPSLLDELQEKLAIIGAPAVREALAINPKLNEKQQNYLLTTGSKQVKTKLAKNPALISSIQSILIADEDWSIREALATNPSLNATCQSKLISDEDVDVKIALACNPAIINDLQRRIVTIERGSSINSNRKNGNEAMQKNLAKNPALSVELMETVLANPLVILTNGLASNTSLPEFLQARLIEKGNSEVMENLAANPALKIAQQAELANIGDVHVRLALYDNPSLDESLKKRITASFTERDLISMNHDIEQAKRSLVNRENDEEEAQRKYSDYDPHSLFGSEKKWYELGKERDRMTERRVNKYEEVSILERKISKLEALTKLETKDIQKNNSFFSLL